MDLLISSSCHDTILAHAISSYPEEGCGLLIGKANRIVRMRPMTNISPNKRKKYLLDPLELIAVEDELTDEEIVGIYHSHPDHPSKPSETDLKMAWPNLSYVIVSVYNMEIQDIQCWKIDNDILKEEKLVKI
ncbi:MAG: M67 family metallopeptidase [Candidatus Heimdallarchaeota archaeon]|nr:M67 family metallopeptidase [Candidatus Heimdallarchaeota archaeon]